jgi:hypothetical protein
MTPRAENGTRSLVARLAKSLAGECELSNVVGLHRRLMFGRFVLWSAVIGARFCTCFQR